MMGLDTQYLEKCCKTLSTALELLRQAQPESIEFELYRSACIKEFEIILEQCGKLLKKCLKPFFATNREADLLTFKDIFRHATLHGFISTDESARWMNYRDNRNSTAHDYGEGFANSTLKLLPQFLIDAIHITFIIQQKSESI